MTGKRYCRCISKCFN